MTGLKHIVNGPEREKFIGVNDALFKIITPIANMFPDPKKHEIFHPNSKRLVEILDEYVEYEGNGRILTVITAVVRVVISKLEHSPNWRDRIIWWGEKLREGEWKYRSLNHPEHDWEEKKPYGVKRG
ncbi:hypothetical protein LCGC14_1202410 [marine sediment metagenome]|uniref:Uncharacterized protein n=1 Tax=marine sediment metagenome TaxID=412755 RepID=A0A0F9LKY2_9ZZZZ